MIVDEAARRKVEMQERWTRTKAKKAAADAAEEDAYMAHERAVSAALARIEAKLDKLLGKK